MNSQATAQRIPLAAIPLERFFSALFPDNNNGFVELRALPSKDRSFLRPKDLKGIRAFLETHHDQDLYFGVASRKSRKNGRLENCNGVRVLHADIDFKNTTEAQARERLQRFPIKPSIVVQSGGGLHAYWLLKEPLTLPEDKARLVSLLRRLAIALGADLSSAEPARVLRVPGTLNRKPEYDSPRPVVIERFTPEALYNASELDDLLTAEPESDGKRLRFTLPEIINTGERNSTLFRLARSLHSNQLSVAAIEAAVCQENELRCKPPLPDDEIGRLLANAASGHSLNGDFSFIRLKIGSIDLDHTPEVPHLLKPLLVRGDIALLAGRWGSLKTWMLLDLLLAGVSGGRVWGRYDFQQPIRVMFIDEDSGSGRIERRLAELARGRGFDGTRLKEIEQRLEIFSDSGFNFRRPDGVRALIEEVDKFAPDLLLFETLVRVQRAADENASVDADRLFNDGLKPFARERGITVLLTHHFRKRSGPARLDDAGERIRGSVGIPDFADQVFALLEGEQHDEVRLIHVKTREAERAPDLLVSLVPGEGGGLVVTSRLPKADRRFEGPMSKVAAAERFCLASLAQHGEDGLTREALIKLGSADGFSEPTIKRGINALLAEETIAAVSQERGAALRLVERV